MKPIPAVTITQIVDRADMLATEYLDAVTAMNLGTPMKILCMRGVDRVEEFGGGIETFGALLCK